MVLPAKRPFPPALGPVALQGEALEEALGREGDDHGLVLNQVLGVEGLLKLGDEGAPRVPVLLLDPEEVGLDLGEEAGLVLEDRLQAGDLLHEPPVLLQKLLPFQGHEALEAHVQDGLGLGLGEAEAFHEGDAGLGGVLGAADQGDDLVNVVQGDEEAFQDVGPLLRLPELKEAPAAHHLLAVVQVVAHQVQEGEDLGLPVHDGEEVHREGGLEGGVLVELVQDHLGVGAPLELNGDPQALPVGLVPEAHDVLNLLGLDQGGDLGDEARLVHLVGDLRHHQDGPLPLLLHPHLGPHLKASPPGGVGLLDALLESFSVGKSGPGRWRMTSSRVMAGFSIMATRASTTSERLWAGGSWPCPRRCRSPRSPGGWVWRRAGPRAP